MRKSLRGTDFTVYLTALGLWNQKMLNFLNMTWLMGVIDSFPIGVSVDSCPLNGP